MGRCETFLKWGTEGKSRLLERRRPGVGVEASRHGRVDVAVDFHALDEVTLNRLGHRHQSEFDLQRLLDAIGKETHDVLADAAGDHRFRLICRGGRGGRGGGKHGR